MANPNRKWGVRAAANPAGGSTGSIMLPLLPDSVSQWAKAGADIWEIPMGLETMPSEGCCGFTTTPNPDDRTDGGGGESGRVGIIMLSTLADSVSRWAGAATKSVELVTSCARLYRIQFPGGRRRRNR